MHREFWNKRLRRTASVCLLLAGFSLAATAARAAGVREIAVPADAGGPAISAWLWTPCGASPEAIPIDGTFAIAGTRDCPIRGRNLPLIVISHGLLGDAFSHHDTAEALADSGFVVVSLNHPMDSALDMTRADELAAFAARPVDIKRVIDFTLRRSPAAAAIDGRRIGFFGFSRGGYTGLVLAGATPDFRRLTFPCPETILTCRQLRDGDIPAQSSGYDPRIKAFVIADPATFFPDKASLEAVKAPIQMWSSALGGMGAPPENLAAIARNLPVRPEFEIVANSAHVSFLFPCAPAFAAVAPARICDDPPGFDRATFHKRFNAEVVRFFRKALRRQRSG